MGWVRPRLFARLTGAALVATLVAASLPAAGVSGSSKPFTAAITPSTFTAGSPGTWNYTITDSDHNGVPTNQALGSAHITIPTGWNVTGVSIQQAPTGKSWTTDVNPSTGQIEVDAATQSDRLTGSQWVSVEIEATPSCVAASPSPWPIVAKESNNFLGSGNDYTLDGPTPALTVSGASGPLGSFTITTSPATATAGQPFSVTATAFDTCGRQKTDYTPASGVTLAGTLSTSAAAPKSDPTGVNPVYGPFGTLVNGTFQSGVWVNGSATASVTAKKADTDQKVTIIDNATRATGTSLPFTVQPGTLYPSFANANQPGDAQVSSTIYSNVLTRTPVTVAVADLYGNPAPDLTNVSMTATNVSTTAAAGLKGTTIRQTTLGVATFDDLSLATIGTYQLTAQVQVDGQSTTSTPFQVVVALKVCDGLNTCTAPASNGKQSADTTITAATDTTFQSGVLLESSFIGNPNECSGFTPIPGTVGSEVEVSTSSGNLQTSRPSFTITYSIPKATLKAAGLNNLGASQFNLCLGAKRLDGGAGAWTDASGNPAYFDNATGYYWGIVPAASSSLPANNPYIASQHKDGAGNLIIVLVKPYPWDGWGYI